MPQSVAAEAATVEKSDRSTIRLVLVGGIIARYLVSLRGFNFDFESYRIVAQLASDGQNIYANTPRYNYGPIWFNILHLAHVMSGGNEQLFRVLLIGVLTAVDVGIFFILYRRLGRIAAFVFFLNPITVIITGYHNQFDNMALLLGLLAVVHYGDDFEGPLTTRKYRGLVLLGVSLITKHLLFLFPFWLAIKQHGWKNKLVVAGLPCALFGLSFLPYWPAGSDGIIDNVFLYNSSNNELFYNWFIPDLIHPLLSSKVLWLGLLVGFAFYFRRRTGFDSLLIYFCVLTAVSPSVSNQYLSIAVPFAVAHLNAWMISYFTIGALFLAVDRSGLHISAIKPLADIDRDSYRGLLVAVLSAGFVWAVWAEQLRSLVRRMRSRV